MRTVIVDDHTLVREGIARILAAAGFSVVGQAASGREGWRLVRELAPDVAVVDAALPELSGIELCRRVRERRRGVAVVLISMFDDAEWRAEAARAGAAAYVLKGAAPEDLVDAVRRAARGDSLLPPPPPEASPLTAREREVIQLIAEGKKTSEIAQLLSRSVATVRAHKASAMRKLGAHTTPELVRKALDRGLGGVPRYGGPHERP
ncbi:response regulator transcription factor [Candidatus Bipolaricaulota bacterium]|nr:response regulator transcription factor [Candidatus Bipolaricaulota bacterium]